MESAIEAIYSHIAEKHGRLDILVNNAVLSPWRSIEDTDRKLMLKALETNMAGYWYMSTGAVKLMKKNSKGSIINISSVAAVRPSVMLGLTKALLPTQGTRKLNKQHMMHNSACPEIVVDPQTFDVFVDGELATCDPAEVLPLAQRYMLR